MKVAELIEKLKEMPQDVDILHSCKVSIASYEGGGSASFGGRTGTSSMPCGNRTASSSPVECLASIYHLRSDINEVVFISEKNIILLSEDKDAGSAAIMKDCDTENTET